MKHQVCVVLAYYDNPTMLERQYRTLGSAEKKVRRNLTIQVVDDGSPRWPARPPAADIGVPGQIHRIDVDVRWNQDAARNIGAHQAPPGSWLLLTDMDHLIPPATLLRVTHGRLDPRNVYRFSRVNDPGLDSYKPHPNSWLLTREMFWRGVRGYDERFAGWYGTDADFRDRVNAAAHRVVMLPEVLIRVPREVTPDASTTTYERKTPGDIENIRRIKEERTREADPSPRVLTFPFRHVATW